MVGYVVADGSPLDLELVVFRDQALIDYEATWLPAWRACAEAIANAAGEPALAPALLKAGGWVEDADGNGGVEADGLLRTGTLLELSQRWIDTQPIVAAHWAAGAAALAVEVEAACVDATARAATPAGPARRALEQLRAAGIRLALFASVSEKLANAQLGALGWSDLFAAVTGADSPSPLLRRDSTGGALSAPRDGSGAVRAAVAAARAAPERAVVVGSCGADLAASRAAGCAFGVAVWPSMARLPAALATAAVRLQHVGELPAVLAEAGSLALRRELASSGGAEATDAAEAATAALERVDLSAADDAAPHAEHDAEIDALVASMA